MTRDGGENEKDPFPLQEGVFSGLLEPLSVGPRVTDGYVRSIS